jgi:hypothetical protein
LAGAGIAVGLYFTWRRVQVATEGQITERFTRAIDQLGATYEHGNKRLEIRLGGIYALERIARDSEKDHWPIMEVLTAYVRENAPWKEGSQPQQGQPPDSAAPLSTEEASQQGVFQPSPRPDTDIQAILTVIGRRRWWKKESKDQVLDLRKTDLRGANLSGAHLERAIFVQAHLEWAGLTHAYLRRALLFDAHLERAILRHVHGLTREQLASAHIDENIRLSDYPSSSQLADEEDT